MNIAMALILPLMLSFSVSVVYVASVMVVPKSIDAMDVRTSSGELF